MNKALSLTLFLTALLALVGCAPDGDGGGDSSNNGANNGANNGDTNNGDTNNGDTNNGDTNNGDTNNGDANNGDANNGDTNNGDANNGGACDNNGFEPARERSTTQGFGIQYAALNTTGTPYDVLLVQIYNDFGGPSEPGTYSLDGVNYADCGLCVLAYSGCGEGQGCEKTFYADAGSVDITSLGGQGDTFAAQLNDVVFQEVTIDPNTFVSTPVEGGQDWCVDGYSYSGEIEDGSGADCGSPGVTCVGEEVTDFSLQNCGTGEMVSFTEMAANQKAAWFVLTAGWCPACRQYIPQVIEQDDMLEGRGLEIIYVLGEDDNYGQPTVEYCQQYASHYTEDIGRFYIDHDGQYSFATLFAHMWPYPDANGAFGLPWNAVVDPETMEYLHADGAGATQLNDVLNDLLAE